MSGDGSAGYRGVPGMYLGGPSGEPGNTMQGFALSPSPEEDEIGLLGRLRRRKLVFASVFVVVLGLVGVGYTLVPRSYRVTASVVVSAPDMVLNTQNQAQAGGQTVGDPADLESQSVVLGSTQLMHVVLDRPGIRAALVAECEAQAPSPWVAELKARVLGPARGCAEQVADDDTEVPLLQDRYTVTASGRSRVIEVAFSSPSPKVAQLMANTLVRAYLDLRTGEKLEPRDAAISWLQTEVNRLGTKLRGSETAIEQFMSSHNLVKGQTAPIASENLSVLSQQLASAQAEQAAAAGRMGQASGRGDTRDVLDSRTVVDLKSQLETVNGQIAVLSSRYGPAYPGLSALQQQRAGLQASLGAETGRVVSSVGRDYQAASARVASLQRQVDALRQQVGAGDNAMTQIAALQRDTDVDRELYLDLTKRLNELQSERRLVVGNAKLVSFGELPDKVFFPKKATFAVTGLLLAVAAASAAALLRDRADGTVRTSGGLQAASGVRVLAHVPHVRRLGSSGSRLAQQLQLPSAFQEAIRGLYAECMLVDERVPLRSLMVTSSLSGEGKTFVTLALGHFAAATGQRVLVVEGDLRQPSFARALSLPGSDKAGPGKAGPGQAGPGQAGVIGLTDYLRGKGEPADVVQASSASRLDVALCGRTATNSTELLSGRRMRQLLDWAGEHYDLVLVDTPPSQLLRDARVLARHVDGVLYCAQWGQSQTATVLDGVHAVQRAGGNVIGLVLGRVETNQYQLYDATAAHHGLYPALSS